MANIKFLDPRSTMNPKDRPLVPGLDSLEGKTIGIIDNGSADIVVVNPANADHSKRAAFGCAQRPHAGGAEDRDIKGKGEENSLMPNRGGILKAAVYQANDVGAIFHRP